MADRRPRRTAEDFARLKAEAAPHDVPVMTEWDAAAFRVRVAEQRRRMAGDARFQQAELQARELISELEPRFKIVQRPTFAEALMLTSAFLTGLVCEGAQAADVTAILGLAGDRLYDDNSPGG